MPGAAGRAVGPAAPWDRPPPPRGCSQPWLGVTGRVGKASRNCLSTCASLRRAPIAGGAGGERGQARLLGPTCGIHGDATVRSIPSGSRHSSPPRFPPAEAAPAGTDPGATAAATECRPAGPRHAYPSLTPHNASINAAGSYQVGAAPRHEFLEKSWCLFLLVFSLVLVSRVGVNWGGNYRPWQSPCSAC